MAQSSLFITDLPLELLQEIGFYLGPRDVGSALLVCHSWYNALRAESFWHKMVLRDFSQTFSGVCIPFPSQKKLMLLQDTCSWYQSYKDMAV
jgi:hypothetical protein